VLRAIGPLGHGHQQRECVTALQLQPELVAGDQVHGLFAPLDQARRSLDRLLAEAVPR
jgi:hypothetical protein